MLSIKKNPTYLRIGTPTIITSNMKSRNKTVKKNTIIAIQTSIITTINLKMGNAALVFSPKSIFQQISKAI